MGSSKDAAKTFWAKCGKYLPKLPLNCTYKESHVALLFGQDIFQSVVLPSSDWLGQSILSWDLPRNQSMLIIFSYLILRNYVSRNIFLMALSSVYNKYILSILQHMIIIYCCRKIIKWTTRPKPMEGLLFERNPEMFQFLRLLYVKALISAGTDEGPFVVR